MIVKNEAHCIEKCLNSVKPYINYWIICDTGSVDNTEEIVKKCLKDIPGEYHKHPWIDFSFNRNKSLELARTKADYILVIDADDWLVVDNPNIFNNLSKPIYEIEIVHNINILTIYNTVQLFKSSIPAKYVGILHECLQWSLDITAVQLEDCRIIYGANGNRSKNSQKYLDDAKILETALLSDPSNSRYVFYLAQSYRDAEELQKSLNLYIYRSKMGGWIEEQYIALFEAAKIAEILYPEDLTMAEHLYLSAYNCNPKRVEALAYLSCLYRKFEQFEKSYCCAKIGCQIAKPKEALFLQPSCYDWIIIDELATSAYYLDKMQEFVHITRILLLNDKLPPSEKLRILDNLKLCEIDITSNIWDNSIINNL